MDATSARLGAAIVTYHYWPQLRETVDALLTQSRPPDELVIVENGSGAAIAAEIRGAYPRLEVIEVGENRGPIAGMNLALDVLLGRGVDAVLLMTHETLLAAGALASLMDRLEEDESVGVVGPVLGFRSRPDDLWSAGGTLDRRTWETDHVMAPTELSWWRDQPPQTVDWLEGACLLYRAGAVRATGRMHDAFFALYDEPDFQLRMRALGWRAECVPAAVAWQEPGDKSPYIVVRNRLGFVARRGTRPALARALAGIVSDLIRDAISPRPGRGGRMHVLQRARGLIDFARGRWGRPPTFTGDR